MKEKRLNEIKGIFFIAAGLIILASLVSFDTHDVSFHTYPANNPPHNLVRMFGAYLSAALVFSIGRIPSFIVPFFVLWIGISFFRQNPPYWSFYRGMGSFILIISSCALIGLFYLRTETLSFYRGGGVGYFISRVVVKYFGEFGGYIVFLSLFLLSFALVTEILVSTLLLKFCKGLGRFDFLVKALPVLELKRGEKRPAAASKK
ncbi:MAG: DNA translocase FtsK 4TM domain-containing protein [Candidatus Omnitrophica bacterium]|nr:DNA translocase FtsK 4TM domain-containing protein [Candidatus Omnitrophota bacterium]